MRIPVSSFLTALVLGVAAIGSAQYRPSHQDYIKPYEDPKQPIDQRVADLLKRMTIQEKARQLDMYTGAPMVDKHDDYRAKPGASFVPESARKILGDLGVGSIHDLYANPRANNAIQKWVIEHNRLGIPALFIEEGLHGFSDADRTGTVYPESINLASTWNTQLAQETGAGIGSEARSCGVDFLLCPVLDVAREPRWGRVEEDFGEDPFLTGELGASYVHGMQGDSLDTDHTCASEPKHFAGHGSPESGLNTSPVHAGEREVRSIMLRSFQPAFERSHAMGAMAAYHEIDGVPCAGNEWLLTQVLRGEWGFKGIVVSDLGAISMLYEFHHVAETPEEAVWLALKSGVDMQFYDFHHDVYQNAIIDGVKNGQLPVSVVNRAVGRVLRLKFSLGLFDHPYVDEGLSDRINRSQGHLATAMEASRESMVLLKNDNGLLPLDKAVHRVAVIGPKADMKLTGDYTELLSDMKATTLLEGIKAAVSAQTEVIFDKGEDLPKAAETARSVDIVIFSGSEGDGISGEGSDRMSLNLPGNQEALLEAVVAANPKTVLVLENGRPLSIPWAAAHVPAILEAWYPGEKGGQVIAETLFGDNNPGGKLPVSFPRDVGTLPDFYNSHPSKWTKYVDGDPTPVYPFGYGLSYTTFEIKDLKVTTQTKPLDVTVSANITNTGKRTGQEVAELYLRPQTSSVSLARIALKGFKRVSLEPGETKTVTFHLTRYELEVWGSAKKWSVEGGKYGIQVGDSSASGLKAEFSLPRAAE